MLNFLHWCQLCTVSSSVLFSKIRSLMTQNQDWTIVFSDFMIEDLGIVSNSNISF